MGFKPKLLRFFRFATPKYYKLYIFIFYLYNASLSSRTLYVDHFLTHSTKRTNFLSFGKFHSSLEFSSSNGLNIFVSIGFGKFTFRFFFKRLLFFEHYTAICLIQLLSCFLFLKKSFVFD